MIRPIDIDRAGDVWSFRPESHKTEHHGRERVICIGPKAQEVLTPYLLRAADTYCFCPVESERKRRAEQHAARKTPLQYGNRPGKNRKRNPKRTAGERYDTGAYRRAITRGVAAVNAARVQAARTAGINEREVELLPDWSPNQLRHSAATLIRKVFGLEAAQVALGHASADITQIYAEKNLTLAAEVARKIG